MTRTAADVTRVQIDRLLRAKPRYRSVANFAERLEDLRTLVEAHHAVGGLEPGRRNERIAALNRAAVVLLASQFQGFVVDLFSEAWRLKYASSPDSVLTRIRINNAQPAQDIDPLFSFLGIDNITVLAEVRPTASSSQPVVRDTVPRFVRAGERAKHQARQVLTELSRVRSHVAHGGRQVPVRLSDVMGYLTDCVHVSVGMAKVLDAQGITPPP